MRRLLLAIALLACNAPRTPAQPPPAPSGQPMVSATPSASASSTESAGKTEGAISVTLFAADGGVEGDASVGKGLAACAAQIGSARGWLLVRVEADGKGKTTSVQIVERVGLPEEVATCISQRIRSADMPAVAVYVSVTGSSAKGSSSP
jgi:hypothetical protein